LALAGFDYTLTPTFARINDDIWPDIALAADFGTAQILLNDSSAPGQFTDGSTTAVRNIQFGMGSALADIDNDGDLDWFVTSIKAEGIWKDAIVPDGNRLLENSGSAFASTGFTLSPHWFDVADGGFGWGACFIDIDNDADLDIYHTNGWPNQFAGKWFTEDRSRIFVATSAGTYVNRASSLGLNDAASGRGVVCADFDNDGDIDILQLTNSSLNSASLWENSSAAAGRNFLRVTLRGLNPNTAAAGARIFAKIGNETQMREVMIGSNYTSQNPVVQVFGLGSATALDELRVEWPGLLPGPSQPEDWRKANVPAGVSGQTLIICHPQLDPRPASCMSPD
jgi:hypothetical protein